MSFIKKLPMVKATRSMGKNTAAGKIIKEQAKDPSTPLGFKMGRHVWKNSLGKKIT